MHPVFEKMNSIAVDSASVHSTMVCVHHKRKLAYPMYRLLASKRLPIFLSSEIGFSLQQFVCRTLRVLSESH